MADRAGAVTRLLRAWERGDVQARDELIPLVYRELRRRAAAYLRRERLDHTLQRTALVHEAFVRLVGQNRIAWKNRAHFFGIGAQMMRRILVDYARERHRAKRHGLRVTLDDGVAATQPPDTEVLALNLALDELTRLDARQGQIVGFDTSAVSPRRRLPPSCRCRAQRSLGSGRPRARGSIAG
jgi:RNA polymerase sigma factor (TIGR02999 family)